MYISRKLSLVWFLFKLCWYLESRCWYRSNSLYLSVKIDEKELYKLSLWETAAYLSLVFLSGLKHTRRAVGLLVVEG